MSRFLQVMRSSSEEARCARSNRDYQPGNTRDVDDGVEGKSTSISKGIAPCSPQDGIINNISPS